MSSSPETEARSSEYERGWALLYRLIRLNGSLSGHERNVLYRNHGDGTFADLSAVAGVDFPQDGRAFVTFDFDRDGDVDILLNNRNSPQLRLLRNDLPTSHHSVAFRLEGAKSNRDAVGARLVLETGSGRRLTRSVRSGSGFRSQPSRTVHFGLGEEEEIRELTIFWPSGTVERHSGIRPGHIVFLKEGTALTEGGGDVTAFPFEAPSEPRPEPEAGENAAANSGATAPEAEPSRTGIWLSEATPAPALRGRSLDGGEFLAEPYRGKRILLNFWATWCVPCQAELADFSEHREALEGAGLVPLLVSVDEPGEQETVRRYVREKQLPFPVLLPDEDTVTAFDLLVRHILDQSGELAIPATFLINESGEILKLYLGSTSADQILKDAGNWPGSGIELLDRALPFPGRAYVTRFERNWVQLGDAYAAAGLSGEAVAALEHAIKVHPQHAAILDRLGSLYAEQGRWQDALEAHQTAVDLGLPGIAARVHLATALAELGRLPEAGAAAREALARAPEDTDALRVWGAVASRQGKFQDALPALLSSRKLDPDNPEVHYNLGWLYLRTGRRKDAAGSLRQAVKLKPGHAKALHDLGILHAQGGSWEQAAASLRKAIEANPEFPEAHYSLGLIYAQQEDFKQAEESLLTALKFRPDYAEALTDLGGVYIQTRQFRQALPLLARAQRLNPNLSQSYLNAVKAHLALGDKQSALVSLEALLKVQPNDPAALALRKRLNP